MSVRSFGQVTIECDVDMSPALTQSWINEASNIAAAAERRNAEPPQVREVPVRFTLINGNSTGFILAPGDLDIGLNNLNQAFAPAGLHFFQCGELNEIWDSRIQQSEDVDVFINSFAYSTGAMEVYIKSSVGKSRAGLSCNAYQNINPNYLDCFVHENWILLVNPAETGKTFIHETGHHFGLLHTFNPNFAYITPVSTNQQDHPYPVLLSNGQIAPNWLGRELAIRIDEAPNSTKPFQEVNYGFAGDALQDTPADCSTFSSGPGGISPGCFISAQSPVTCEIDANLLLYRNYNNDPLHPLPPGSTGTLGRNYMSYWRADCLNQFSPGQLNIIPYFYDTYNSPSYALTQCGNFTDAVELGGSSTGLQNTTLRVRHSNDARVCNVTSSPAGKFSGTFHSDLVKTWAYHNGKKSTLKNAGDPLKQHYGHTPCEWRRGLSTFDLALINKHILGIDPFNSGYKIIASDANKSNSVTTFDILELRKLLLGIYEELPMQEQPWRFIPEFIPQDYTASFNANPFNINGGNQMIGAAYLEQGWEYSAANLPANKRGWDAIKIGDVNDSWLTDAACPNENESLEDAGAKPNLTVPSVSLTQNQEAALVFRVNGFNNVEAFQLGIRLPADKLEVLDATTASLPGYAAAESFGIGTIDPDAAATLWFDPSGGALSLPANSEIFTIVVKAQQAIPDLGAILKLDNSILKNQIWQTGENGASLTVTVETPKERTKEQTAPNNLVRLTAYPNPFNNYVTVVFLNTSPEEDGLLTVTDMTGKVVFERKTVLLAGQNYWDIHLPHEMAPGIYRVSLTSTTQTSAVQLSKY